MCAPPTRPLRPIFVVGGLYAKANGVAWIMRDLAAALGRAGAPVAIYGADCLGRASIMGELFEPPARWVTARGLWLGGLSWSPELKPILRRAIAQADIVHNHSLWMLPNSYSSRLAQRLSRPVVITAHGALEPWALRHSGWKKRLAGAAFQYRDLRSADCIHVNSRRELEGVRRLGLRSPVAVIPNGVHLPDFDDLPDSSVFGEHFPAVRDRKIALFMGRLHKKKGVDVLLRAWAGVHQDFPDWQLVVAGPDNGAERGLRSLVHQQGLAACTTFTGNLEGHLKGAALAAANAFVLPSQSEGFSMAVIEALASRIPVLLTPGCNFPEARDAEAAVEAPPTVAGVAEGLRQLLALPESHRRAMGLRGRGLVEQSYTWDGAAQDMLQLYRWLGSGGERPAFVELS